MDTLSVLRRMDSPMTRKPTIFEALATKLGREPTHTEAVDEVMRILSEAGCERAERKPLRGKHERT